MPKLHELLAVEASLRGQAETTRTGLKDTFAHKRHLFEEKLTTFTPNEEDGGEPRVETQSALQTTVNRELNWLGQFLAKHIDAGYAIAEANTRARADLVLEDGTVLAKDLPATTLLELEKRIGELAEVLRAIPTLDPAKGFVADDARGEGIFKAREVAKTRTRKTNKALVLYPATEKHPAQVQLVAEDVPVGTVKELEWSGMLTPARKSELLDRAEKLARAVRQARSRANEVLVEPGKKIAENLLGYVLKG